MAESQIRLALLEALENAIQTGDFVFDVESVRSKCRAFKCYDVSNFVRNFRNNEELFEGFEKGAPSVKLSSAGRERLAAVVAELGRELRSTGVPALPVVEQYDAQFQRLLKISAPANVAKSYLEVLDAVCGMFKENVVIPLHTAPAQPSSTEWERFVDGLPHEESEYLAEALACARVGYLRAATVLGWCACVDRLHRKVEQLGFVKFNATSAGMKGQNKGRFKKFNKVLGVSLQMRNHAAHPGELRITEYNLMSFFSEIAEIVLRNPKFALALQPHGP